MQIRYISISEHRIKITMRVRNRSDKDIERGRSSMSVTYDKLTVSGITYNSILKFDMSQQVNQHATAELHLEMEKQNARKYMDGVYEEEIITIGIPEVIFAGMIKNVSLCHEETYNVIKLNLISTSVQWDINKVNRSYQRVGDTYSRIMKKATNGVGAIEFCGNDIASAGLIVQYQETIWEFILRLSSLCEEPVYVNPASVTPYVTIGVQSDSDVYESNIKGIKSEAGNQRGYVSLGGKTASGAEISSTKTSMKNGELVTSYTSMPTECLVPEPKKMNFAGKVMAGIVQAVDRDLVQVHITDLDSEYDSESTTWFPYSTLYSSGENEAGIYCMPQEKDPVRVFFPSDNMSEAFASSSVNARGATGDSAEKCFQTPEGMKVLFGKEGLFVSCGKKNIWIRLYKNGTVGLYSETSIGIHANENVTMKANEGKVCLESEESICMLTGNSVIAMQKDNIKMVADRIMTQ